MKYPSSARPTSSFLINAAFYTVNDAKAVYHTITIGNIRIYESPYCKRTMKVVQITRALCSKSPYNGFVLD